MILLDDYFIIRDWISNVIYHIIFIIRKDLRIRVIGLERIIYMVYHIKGLFCLYLYFNGSLFRI